MTDNRVKVALDLSAVEAEALAQFLKRVGYADWRAKAQGEHEAEALATTGRTLASGLAKAGFNPR